MFLIANLIYLCQTLSKRKNAPRYLGCATKNLTPNGSGICTTPRQLSGHRVAQEVERHLDTPNFCVRVISDIYQPKVSLST